MGESLSTQPLNPEDDKLATNFALVENMYGTDIKGHLDWARSYDKIGDTDAAEDAKLAADEVADNTDRVANLWRAQQHKNEHLDQYIESARLEAEAQGVHINIEPPKAV